MLDKEKQAYETKFSFTGTTPDGYLTGTYWVDCVRGGTGAFGTDPAKANARVENGQIVVRFPGAVFTFSPNGAGSLRVTQSGATFTLSMRRE